MGSLVCHGGRIYRTEVAECYKAAPPPYPMRPSRIQFTSTPLEREQGSECGCSLKHLQTVSFFFLGETDVSSGPHISISSGGMGLQGALRASVLTLGVSVLTDFPFPSST